MKTITLLLLALASSIGYCQNGIGVDKWIVFRPYLAGTMSNVTAERHDVITSQNQFQKYWHDVFGRDPKETPTDVDFNTEELVAIHLGRRPSTGYSLLVTNVERGKSLEVKVSFFELLPQPGFAQGQIVTSPWVIVRLPRITANYVFAKVQGDVIGGVPAVPPITPFPGGCNCQCGCGQIGKCTCGGSR